MIAGSIERDVSTSNPTVFFMITGAFHSTNTSLELKNKIELDPLYNVYRDYPYTEVAFRHNYKKDGFRSLVVDPSNTANTLCSVMWSKKAANAASPLPRPEFWVFSLTRDFISYNWIQSFSETIDTADITEAIVTTQVAPATGYLVLL